MVRVTGVDPGEYEAKVIEFDGSYRKPRLTKVGVAAVTECARGSEESHAAAMAASVEAAIAGAEIGHDNVQVACPSREAVLRLMNVPFVGRDQIRKVIKFEAENEIHSHNVDEMVVDFHVIAEMTAETRVMIAAVPKSGLKLALGALASVGVDPEVVDLDALALFRTAEWYGAFNGGSVDLPPASGDGVEELPATQAAVARLVLDLGARSTRVLVVVNGHLVDVRTLRIGADAMAEEVAEKMGIDLAAARDAVAGSLGTEEDFVLIDDEEAGADAGGDGDTGGDEASIGSSLPVPSTSQLVLASDVRSARDHYFERLRREFVRFLTSVAQLGSVEQVWVTGGASTVDGVDELLAELFDVEPRRMELLDKVNHRLGEDEARELEPKLAVAIGLALSGLGGPSGFNFRQEELAFTRGFDRIKFPLAIASMLALFLVLVFALKTWRELKATERVYGSVWSVQEVKKRRGTEKKATFNGYVGALVNDRGWFQPSLSYFDDREFSKLVNKLLAADTFDRLGILREEVKRHFRDTQRESGYYPELRLGSGLGALVETAQVLDGLGPQIGRYLLLDIELRLNPKEPRYVKFEIVLRSDEVSPFRQKWRAIDQAFRERCKDPTSCFLSINEKVSSEKSTFEDESGGGAYFTLQANLRPEASYPVFPRSAP